VATQPPVADWSVKNGELIGIRDFRAQTLLVGELEWSNYSIQAEIKLVQRFSPPNISYAGFEVYSRGFGDAYIFGLTFNWNGKNGLLGGVVVNNNFPIEKGFKQFEPQVDKWYTLKVDVQNATSQVFLDSELTFEFKDKAIASGKTGVSVRYMQANFDNVVIKGDDVPNQGQPFAVSPHTKLATTWTIIKQGR